MGEIDTRETVKVSFLVGEHNESVETMHATRRDDGCYVLGNSPFYAYGISWLDVFVAAVQDEVLVFSHIVERSGHSTYRVSLPVGRDHAFFLRYWSELEAHGCTFEGSSANPRRLYSLDVPADADVHAIYRLLEAGERDGHWVFEEAHYCDPWMKGVKQL